MAIDLCVLETRLSRSGARELKVTVRFYPGCQGISSWMIHSDGLDSHSKVVKHTLPASRRPRRRIGYVVCFRSAVSGLL